MVIASVTPDFYSLTILFVLRLHIRISIYTVSRLISKHILTIVLSEDTQIGRPVLLPEAFEHFVSGRSEHSNSTGLPIDPISFERTSIRPYQLSIATFVVLVVHYGLVRVVLSLALLEPVLLTGIHSGHIACLVNRNQPDLTHVLKRAKLHGLNC